MVLLREVVELLISSTIVPCRSYFRSLSNIFEIQLHIYFSAMADVKEPEVFSSLEDNTNDESTLVRKFKSTDLCE